MTTDNTRVWLLPNGNPLTSFEVPGTTRYEEHYVIDRREGAIRRTHYHDELPEGAVPLVPIPVEQAHREGDCVHVASHIYRYTLERADEQVEYLTKRLGHALAVQKFLKRESTSMEAGRRKVLQDLKPGVYNLHDELGNAVVVVTPDGRLLVHQKEGFLLDITMGYRDRWAEDLTLLCDGELSLAVTG